MAGALGSFKQDHHVIAGAALVTVGIFGLIGSLTGNLATMLAALFDPSDLSSSSGGSNPVLGVPPKTTGGTPEDPTEPVEPNAPALPGAPELPPASTPALPSGIDGILDVLEGLA